MSTDRVKIDDHAIIGLRRHGIRADSRRDGAFKLYADTENPRCTKHTPI